MYHQNKMVYVSLVKSISIVIRWRMLKKYQVSNLINFFINKVYKKGFKVWFEALIGWVFITFTLVFIIIQMGMCCNNGWKLLGSVGGSLWHFFGCCLLTFSHHFPFLFHRLPISDLDWGVRVLLWLRFYPLATKYCLASKTNTKTK